MKKSTKHSLTAIAGFCICLVGIMLWISLMDADERLATGVMVAFLVMGFVIFSISVFSAHKAREDEEDEVLRAIVRGDTSGARPMEREVKKFCGYCGTGLDISKDKSFCGYCGKKV